MNQLPRVALVGAGIIGRKHLAAASQASGTVVFTTIVDPTDASRRYADTLELDWHRSLSDAFAQSSLDGVVIATPNQVHVENAMDCIEASCPMLIEKPIATTSVEARRIVNAASPKQVPILVGHHRRYNPLIEKARYLIQNGFLGRIATVHASCWLMKPESYFDPDWRRNEGAGVVSVNAVHDVDLLRHLFGEIRTVMAIGSNAVRNLKLHETSVAILQFYSGVVGTLTISDTVMAPWSWELTSGENTAYPATLESCYFVGGTKGSLSIPDNRLWRHEGEGHWMQPISATTFTCSKADPLVAQLRHFAAVIRGEEEPLVSGEEGMKSLRVVEAILNSMATGDKVFLD